MARKQRASVIATLPPYVEHRQSIASNQLVSELRFNTVSPLAESRFELLRRLKGECGGKRLWIDLKARQLRITKFAYLPYAYVELNHAIEVQLPVTIHFKECSALVSRIVDGNKLILSVRPPKIVGEGQPVNILHPSLKIMGFLTESDREYIEAAKKLDMHDYMLSFVERAEDIDDLLDCDREANIVAKIESRRGLEFVRGGYLEKWRRTVRLMAARDDLYINLDGEAQDYLPALEAIIAADPKAIVASRLLTSLEDSGEVDARDVSDLELMLRLGYRTLMLSDGLCFHEGAYMAASRALAGILLSRIRRR
jgi:pyruvate kinase